jgi:hypothetical protein
LKRSAMEDEHRAEVRRVLESAFFARAPRLCMLLSHISEHTLNGTVENLTEQQIGIQIFRRAPGYDSAEDTIVRGTARHLRHRLASYYDEEGRNNPLRISIPKGSYVARFDDAQSPVAVLPDQTDDVPIMPSYTWPPSSSRWMVWAALAVAAISLMLAAVLFFSRKAAPPPSMFQAVGPQALWQQLFTPGRKTLLVPGDASLDTFIAWEQRPVSVADYSQQSYQKEAKNTVPPNHNDVGLGIRSMTPMADLKFVSELVRVPEWMGLPNADPWIDVRYARDLIISDVHDSNLILIGAETFNPWISLYQKDVDFHVNWDFRHDVFTVTNSAPLANEKASYTYTYGPNSKFPHPYTHIAFLDSQQGPGKVLIVDGTSMGSTYAALTFLKNEALWKPVIQAATAKDGHLRNFEVLLESSFVRGGTSNTHVVCLHVH